MNTYELEDIICCSMLNSVNKGKFISQVINMGFSAEFKSEKRVVVINFPLSLYQRL